MSNGTMSEMPLSGVRSVRVDSPDGTPLGFLEVDRVVAGRCCGGIRASATVTAEELRRIAAVMTLKCGFVGLAAGGAKGGVVMPAGTSREERIERFEAYGCAVGPILRSCVWSYGVDLGTAPADIVAIRRGAGLERSALGEDAESVPCAPNSEASSADPAGLTVALSTEAAIESIGRSVRGARIAVQGAGAVGRAAIAALDRSGARIIAAATIAGTVCREDGLEVGALLEGLARLGDGFTGGPGALPATGVFDVDCDALLVCAGTATVDGEAAAHVRARTVICGANIPFADGVEAHLAGRGVLVIPDFMAGAGGVLGTTLEAAAGATRAEIEAIFRRRFKPLVAATVAAAAARGEPAAAEGRRRALRILHACDAAYGEKRPDSLLPDRLAPNLSAAARLCLALERRARGSSRLASLARRLHALALARADDIVRASLAVGAVESV